MPHADPDGRFHSPGAFVLCDRVCLVSVSCAAVAGEDALVIAAMVAAGVGDVGEPGVAEGAGDEVAQDGTVLSSRIAAQIPGSVVNKALQYFGLDLPGAISGSPLSDNEEP